MRIREIISEDTDTTAAVLMSVLSFVKKRAENSGTSAKVKTRALINMVQNAGDSTFNYDSLVQANSNDPAVKNLIKSFNQDEVIIGSHDPQDVFNPDQAKAPTDVVGGMAKQAMNKRM